MWDVHMTMRIQSLPLLENLSSQILQTLGRGPYQETLTIVTQPESNQGQAYNSIKRLFDQAKKIYTSEAFLSAEELKLDTPEQRAIIRKVNLATFVSSVFGSQEVGFFHLNEHFMDTFVPDGGRMLKSQGSLYLDLKTQAYISAMATNERSKEEILEDLFPEHMASLLLSRRPGAKQLTPSEADFVSRLIHRRNHLMQISDQVNLSEKYAWQEFLKDVSWYVSKNHETIVAQPTRKTRKRMSHGGGPHPEVMSPPVHAPPTISPMVHHVVQQTPVPLTPEEGTAAAIVQAHTAALSASPHPNQQTPTDPALENEMFSPNTSYMGAPPLAQPPVPQQSQPTQVLYERARLAVTSKASPNARRAGLPSQRRPWTTEEENALMAGLDRVKGPHWSQILAMFGPGGTVSEALKDRNQVQLKDKARNLKLFFLKSGMEVPYYLQFVTGELKTRAPGQAAKNAAKKAVEESAEEDAAHVAAVTALGNAHRSNSHDMTAAYGGISEGSECADMSQPPDSEGSEQGSAPPPERLDMQPPVGTAPQQQVAPQVPIAPVAPMGLPSQDESMTSAAMQQTQNVNESSSIEVRL
ncbi:telomere repeat binding factor-domain-containing protein [Sphaerosporella brunnea]|uniref:Telomere repeat binding factor-domain-containing protein n=1 Tax=Sphaerosporella brunnea TaxID=1250544 RepID=A0A5J5EQU2_9PEZI|nr:telomere repeat binding factor-domain-containing protein [Sphaerosporella brunnea]